MRLGSAWWWGLFSVFVSPLLLAAPSWHFDIEPASLTAAVNKAVSPWRSATEKSWLPNIPGLTLTKEDQKPLEVSEPEVRDALTAALQAYGYYTPEISLIQRADSDWLVRVRAGEPVTIAHISLQLTGALTEDKDFIVPAFTLSVGSVLDQLKYEQFKQHVADTALERGYYEGEWVSSDIALDLQARQADITLHFVSGPRYRFGAVTYVNAQGEPLKALDSYWQSVFVPFKVSDPITSAALQKFQHALQESRYFTQVSVNLLRQQTDGYLVPVEVRADTTQPNRVSTGLGYATDVGPRITWQAQRYLLNPVGHGVEVSSELSQIRQQVELRYKVPWRHPVEDTLQFLLGAQKDRINDTDTVKTVVGIQRVMLPLDAWQRTFGVRLSEEHFRRDSGERGAQQLLVPSYSISRLRSQGGLDPVSGFRQFYQIEGAHPSFLSDAKFVSLRTGVRWLNTYAQRHMLLLRLDAGGIITPDFSQVPPSMRFYAGGDSSVRGYEYRSLTPKNSAGELVGGQLLVAGSVEYNWRWKPSWRPAVFIDAGNAYTGRWQKLPVGAGVGMRWISPVGPISMDVASAISEPGRPLRLHLTLGTSL